jgi:hypothetical protein
MTFFSPYKEVEYSITCRSFISRKLAQSAMKSEALHLYKNSRIIQGASDKYFDENTTEVHFGERPDGPDYRREFGFCQIQSIILEDEESEADVSSKELRKVEE